MFLGKIFELYGNENYFSFEDSMSDYYILKDR